LTILFFLVGWNVAFDNTKTLKDYGMERMGFYKAHIESFFEFYGSFDFEGNVICPFLGEAIPISSYRSTDWVKPGDLDNNNMLEEYKNNIRTFQETKVNVADMLNLNFNVAYGVGAKRMKTFKIFCAHAVDLLQTHLII
jgi:hypothetical protein